MKTNARDELARKLIESQPKAWKHKRARKKRLQQRKAKRITHNQIVREALKRLKAPEYTFVPERYIRKVIRVYNVLLREYLALGYEVCIPKIGKVRVAVRSSPRRTRFANQAEQSRLEAQLHAVGARSLKDTAKHQHEMAQREAEARRRWKRKHRA